MTIEHPAHQALDTCGLNCPLPILRTKKALADLTVGQVLKVSTTDPGAPDDLKIFAQQTGHTLLEQKQGSDGVWWHWIQKG